MAALDWLQQLLGGGQYGDPSTPAMPTSPLEGNLYTGGALGQAGLPADGAKGYTADVLQHLKDVISGRVANEGVLGGAYQGDNRALDIAGGLVGAIKPIRAYHGSPHSFDRFDLSKIGTGEGAQAYGHGLYFAENEGVAKGYRDALAPTNTKWMYGNRELSGAEQNAAEILDHRGSADSALGWLKIVRQGRGADQKYLDATEEAIRRMDPSQVRVVQSPGHMYEVDIHADPKAFLDWDKSLAGQSPDVLAALQQKLGQQAGLPPGYRLRQTGSGDYMVVDDLGMGATGKGGMVARGRTPEEALRLYLPSGEEFYQKIARDSAIREGIRGWDDAGASAALREAGIPGIRYLDQGSRGAGTGTSNYAVFDDKLIEILRKYGILPPLAAGGLLGAAEE